MIGIVLDHHVKVAGGNDTAKGAIEDRCYCLVAQLGASMFVALAKRSYDDFARSGKLTRLKPGEGATRS